MTSRERETQAAVAALKHRLQNRGDSDGQFATDDEMFAREYVTALVGFGWRPVEALRDARKDPPGTGLPESEEALTRLEQTRRELEEVRARQHAEREQRAERERLAAEHTTGDAA
jgi:hypothetical protein